ncbi:MAG: imelysin family protein [Hyphomicrobiales bacterium]
MTRPLHHLLLAGVLLCIGTQSGQAETDHRAIAQAALTNVIRPGYAALSTSTTALKQKTDALCAEPSAKALQATKEAFAAAVDSWSNVEMLRFGPVIEDHRYERLFFWPDPKGIGLRQVEKALAEKDETVTLADSLADKSVALQGFPALEYLLYGDGAEDLAKADPEVGFRCLFAASIATNIDRMAGAVAEEWRDGAEAAKLFVDPSPNDPLYRAPKDVTLELSKAFTSGLELVRDQKLGKPLGTSIKTARPRLAAFWRSGLTFPNMIGNLEGVRTLFDKSGFAGVVASESPGVEDSILFDIDHNIDVLQTIDVPIAEAARDEQIRAEFEALRVGLKGARDTAGTMIARGAGLGFGFNALDGD